MPYVNIRITKDGVTKEQKAQIVEEITHTWRARTWQATRTYPHYY